MSRIFSGLWCQASGCHALALARRPLLALTATLLLAPLGCGPDLSPGLVIVTIDTLRADHLSTYGYFRETSPHIDTLAQESVVFENAFSTAAITLPSHVALFTSLHPNRTGVLHNRFNFTVPESGPPVLLAQWLRDAGWQTGAFVGGSPVGSNTGIQTGFEAFRGPQHRVKRPGLKTTRDAIAWLSRVKGPFFLWVHYFEPHGPHEPEEGFDIFHADEDLREFLAMRAFGDPDDADLLEQHDHYDDEIAYVDHEVGKLLTFLRESGRWEHLAIVVTADHGEGLGEHGVSGHTKLGREQLHVPLLMKLPGVAAERRTDLASTLDVVPTLIGSLGLPVPRETAARLEGTDLMRGTRDHAFAQRGRDQYSFVTSDWRYVDYRGETRLFDRRSDPHELANVAADHLEVLERLRVRAADTAGETPTDGLLVVAPEVSKRRLRQLRALGYVSD